MNTPEMLEKISELSDNQRFALVKDAVDTLEQTAKQDMVVQGVKQLPTSEKMEILADAAKTLTDEEKIVIKKALDEPTQKTTDTLWLIIIWAFAIAFVSSIFAMIYSSLALGRIDDKLIIIFTTTSAFLAGLIAPTPMKS